MLRIIFSAALAISALTAQIRSGTIIGRVTDPSGAVAPGVEIVIRDIDTNFSFKVTTPESGEFVAPYLQAGSYEITARKSGFKTAFRDGMLLSTAQTVRADVTLEVGTTETSVSVTASAIDLQSESSSVTNSVSGQLIKSIPNINNNPLNYAALQLGVVARASMNETQTVQSFGIGTEGRRTFSNFQINGAQAFGNDVQLDGVSIQASAWNEVAVLPNTEGIQEVKTTVNNMSAEYGRSVGTVIITTKSGGNRFHGSGQFRLRNEALNANSFENNANQPYVSRLPFKQQGYSLTFGGPVTLPKLYNGKDKTFFFTSYEGFRFHQAIDYFRSVPTPIERSGDFSRSLAQVGAAFVPVQIFDPFNVTPVPGVTGQWRRNAFPGSIIPASRIDSGFAKLVNDFPDPNRAPDDPRNLNNFYNRMVSKYDRDAVNARFDHRMSRHSLYGAFGSNLGSIDTPNGWGPTTRAFTRTGGFIGAIIGDRNYYGSVGDTWIISPTTVADIRVGVTRVAAENRASTFSDLDYTAYGVPASFLSAPGLRGAFPEWNQTGGFSVVSGLNNTGMIGKIERQTNWNLVSSVTKTLGRWTHKWGGEYRNYLSNYADARGSYQFLSPSTFTAGNIIQAQGQTVNTVTAPQNGSPIASALLGAGDIQAGEDAALLALSAKYGAFYSQSDWRAASKLTINIGLRYDLQQAPSERYDRMSSFSYRGENPFGARGNLVFPGRDGYGRSLWRMPRDNWGPRLGFAYRLTDSWVVRSGFGVTYTPSNTGYFGSPAFYGVRNFIERTNSPTAAQYGSSPAGALVAPYNRVTRLVPVIGANRLAPELYGSNAGSGQFDYDDMKNGKILQWNLFVERRIARQWLAQIGYSGARGYHLQLGRRAVNSNQDLPDSLLQDWRGAFIAANGTNPANQLVANPFQPATGALLPFDGVFANPTVPRRNLALPYALFPTNLVSSPEGFYTHHAMMAQLQKNLSGGVLFSAHYTWSRTIEAWYSEAQGQNVYGTPAGQGSATLDRRNLSNSYSISTNDIPHRLVATWVWTPPTPFRAGFARNLFAGWNVGGVFTAQSGQPQQGFTGPTSTGSMTSLGDRISGVPVEVPKELQRWYTGPNTADRTVTLPSGRLITVCRNCFLKYSSDAFSGRVVTLPNGTVTNDIYWFGTSANRYGDIRGNGRWNVNMSLQKQFAISEKLKLQISAEASNLFNNTQFRPTMNLSLGDTFTSLSAAQRAQGVRPGMIQNDSFGTWGMSTFGPRQIELRLRIFF